MTVESSKICLYLLTRKVMLWKMLIFADGNENAYKKRLYLLTGLKTLMKNCLYLLRPSYPWFAARRKWPNRFNKSIVASHPFQAIAIVVHFVRAFVVCLILSSWGRCLHESKKSPSCRLFRVLLHLFIDTKPTSGGRILHWVNMEAEMSIFVFASHHQVHFVAINKTTSVSINLGFIYLHNYEIEAKPD